MKKTHTFSFFFAIVVALLAFASKTFAIADTVKYRITESYLNDSSIIRYEFGSICHKSGGSSTYLSFSDSSKVIDSLWRTMPFTLTSGDSITFFRFASFDDQHEVRMMVTDSASRATFLMACWNRYRLGFCVRPSPSAFGYNSVLRYIVQLHRASNDSLLANIDTLRCFLDDSGRFVFSAKGDGQIRRFASSTTYPYNVYLNVKREVSLPVSGSIIVDTLQLEAHNVAKVNNWRLAFQMLWSTPAPSIAKAPQASVEEPVLFSSSIQPGEAIVTLWDVSGRNLYRVSQNLNAGVNQISIPPNRLQSNLWFLTIEQRGRIVQRSKFYSTNSICLTLNVNEAPVLSPLTDAEKSSHRKSRNQFQAKKSKTQMHELWVDPVNGGLWITKGYGVWSDPDNPDDNWGWGNDTNGNGDDGADFTIESEYTQDPSGSMHFVPTGNQRCTDVDRGEEQGDDLGSKQNWG